MKSIAISGSPRENVGKRDAKELRYEGKVPAVLYGGKNQIHFSVSASDLKSLVYTPEVSFVALDVAGVKAQAIIQDVHFHPLTDLPLHVDFLELDEKKPVVMLIPVKLTGTSPGVKIGGKLVQKLRKLRVKALPKDMPQYVEVSISKLEVGKSVGVGSLKFDNFIITNNPEDTIVSVTMSRALKQAENDAKK
ncbi:MAG: 50S ribosomal protein L25/general stress protein Ctc [Sphingobacteriales bacterium 17-39-43]|uniref:50S ribosomal protein L25/general stress protein Ctc n=1 Tax=Daejeonella sp. TaxID=2805397 RepID=UPI000BD185FB|nr:50S ribosomal protein L25/general stress protein Ctc [Daejeonella sp.]MCF8453192.1 50S ribosomal protein L25/general stress protein Ctc [Pedobacter sp.]OYZ30590.1 MAG: 50S ribosomal protein L25/general stress protein Ctc [Sphingobacteriales bacterium 16-39-50]OZA23283.1 MAG: 50S ribosomal protein L25/general stress protein Ctc [Sphingobacteriales bacterium 17-39-43]HQT23419.1 50S ribosomal protein L25/general stress protein Ctc [Daejeonella sp.]HQT57888.1 50S ribosomal protein L25/general s